MRSGHLAGGKLKRQHPTLRLGNRRGVAPCLWHHPAPMSASGSPPHRVERHDTQHDTGTAATRRRVAGTGAAVDGAGEADRRHTELYTDRARLQAELEQARAELGRARRPGRR